MLVLGRKVKEGVTCVCACGCRMEITVVDADRNKVRLGFVAPLTTVIMRNELMEPDLPRESPPPPAPS